MDLRVGAYAVVTDADDRLLLARWHEGRRAAWTLPGGGLDDGEDPADAVRREVREETGYEVALDRVIGIHSRVISARRRFAGADEGPMQALRIVYRATVVGGRLRDEERGSTDRAAWFPRGQVPSLHRVKLVDAALRMAE